LLSVRGLTIDADGRHGFAPLVRDVSFDIDVGQSLGLIGESGSGKTLTCMALVGLLPRGVRVTSGQVMLEGSDLARAAERQLRQVRGSRIGFVFQDPSAALDPLSPVGGQLAEVARTHLAIGRAQARQMALELMDELEIPRARERFRAYPHELSGGMKQRMCIAMALAGNPRLLIADEPTTALDVTTERTILDLISRLRRERDLALLLVTHSLPVAALMTEQLRVMYAGEMVESGQTADCLAVPGHPYTEALAESARSVERSSDGRLRGIPGAVPGGVVATGRCVFAPRCPYATDQCLAGHPPWQPTHTGSAACIHVGRARKDGGR
jgi:oligopeptide/dipeptide ABC transporter ATP-binding protein